MKERASNQIADFHMLLRVMILRSELECRGMTCTQPYLKDLEKFEVKCSHLQDSLERIEKEKSEMKDDQVKSQEKYNSLQNQ